MKTYPKQQTKSTGTFAPPQLMRPLPVTLSADDLQWEAMLSDARRQAELKGLPDHAAKYAYMTAALRRRRHIEARQEGGDARD